MVEWWWVLAGASIPTAIQQIAKRRRRSRVDDDKLNSNTTLSSSAIREKGEEEVFVCERVCTSKRMLAKVGAFSKDPTPQTCVTVCGVSEVDACAEACARTVCVNQHHVPNWNDVCQRRCQNECLRLRP